MRYTAAFFAFMVLGLADVSQAGQPLITIYNYTAPAPSLTVVSTKPGNRQEFDKDTPKTAEITFTQTINEDQSTFTAYDPYNNVISGKKTMPKDTRMAVTLPDHLLAGTYRLEWKAMCACAGAAVITGTSYFTVY